MHIKSVITVRAISGSPHSRFSMSSVTYVVPEVAKGETISSFAKSVDKIWNQKKIPMSRDSER